MEKEEILQKARHSYLSDDIEIDDDAVLSETDDGVWVQAWVWIPFETKCN